MVLVVYMMYYIVLCYIPQDIGGIHSVVYIFMLHHPGYWWCIWCIRSFYVASPRILVVYMMYCIVLCYIPYGTGGIYGVLHRSMLHSPWYWWYIWCTTSFYATSPRILIVYIVKYILIAYFAGILQIIDILERFTKILKCWLCTCIATDMSCFVHSMSSFPIELLDNTNN